jgi:basic membrane protein A
MKKLLAASAILLFSTAAPALSGEVAPGLLYNMGGKFDKSFNEAAFRGAEKFTADTSIAVLEFEPSTEAQREQALRNMARRGANIIVAVSFAQTSAVETVAAELPDVKFTLIDGVVDAPNVQSIVFKEHEGSFLVGALAAMASKTGKVGFIGGMDIPLIRKFACGYEQGAKHVNPDAEVIVNMTGNTPAAWNDPTKGSELARSQFDRGVDVVFAAAGGTGTGVYQAAVDSGKLAIGVDSNQNHLHPGTMLSSMVKRVDVAVEEAYRSAMDGTWEPGLKVLGLSEDGVAWALDEHNRDLVSAQMEEALDAAQSQIVSGEIVVADYTIENACAY